MEKNFKLKKFTQVSSRKWEVGIKILRNLDQKTNEIRNSLKLENNLCFPFQMDKLIQESQEN